MNKVEVLAVLAQVKEVVEAKIAEVSALPDEVPPSEDEEKVALKAKVEELSAELASVKESLSKDEAKIESALSDLQA